MNELVHYDAMRRELAVCARIDECLEIRDKAAALAAYMRQRNDHEAAAQLGVIVQRACIRVGVLSAELETVQGQRNDLEPPLTRERKSKEQSLREAGLAPPTARRYEQLAAADAETEELQQAGLAAGERYLAECLARNIEPRQDKLRDIVREAIGAPPPAKPEPLPQHALDALRELDSPAAEAWSQALAWLREAAELPPVADLFADRWKRFDHAFPEPLATAKAWIAEFSRRFRP